MVTRAWSGPSPKMWLIFNVSPLGPISTVPGWMDQGSWENAGLRRRAKKANESFMIFFYEKKLSCIFNERKMRSSPYFFSDMFIELLVFKLCVVFWNNNIVWTSNYVVIPRSNNWELVWNIRIEDSPSYLFKCDKIRVLLWIQRTCVLNFDDQIKINFSKQDSWSTFWMNQKTLLILLLQNY